MAPPRKRVTLGDIVSDGKSAVRELLINQPIQWVKSARERMKDLPKTNMDLGNAFATEGKWMDAIFRYRVALFFDPKRPQAWYNIGVCYLQLGRSAQARAALVKALKQNPNDSDTIYMLATVDASAVPASQRPQRMPKDMVTRFFTDVAESYDITEAGNKYQAGKIIYDMIKPLVKSATPLVLDLGCGTGIAARSWRAEAGSVVGVDITPAMVRMADKANHAEKKLFNTLVEADMAQLPPSVTGLAADVVLMVNVVQFIGDLAETMQSAAKAIKDGGLLVVTFEPYKAAGGFGLSSETSRFGHTSAYIKQVGNAAALTVVKEANVMLYADVPAQMLVFSKGTL